MKSIKKFYGIVLRRLIAGKIPNVGKEWTKFKNQLKDALKKAVLATNGVNKGLAQTFVNQLRDEFSEGSLQSDILSSAFSIDCTGNIRNATMKKRQNFNKIAKRNEIKPLTTVSNL